MLLRVVVLIVVSSIAGVTPCLAGDKASEPQKLTALRSSWKQAKERDARPVKGKYLNALIDLRKRLTQQGSLEGALLVRDEIEVLTQGKEREQPKDGQGVPSRLTTLRATYERELARIDKVDDKKYVGALTAMQASFQKADKLDAALAIKRELEGLTVAADNASPGDARSRLDIPFGMLPGFRGMVGKYRNGDDQVPVLLFSQPTKEKGALCEAYREHLKSSLGNEYPVKVFEAYGYILVPAKASYRIEAGRATILKIDGKQIELDNYARANGREFTLDEGVHKVELLVHNNGGQLYRSYLKIENLESKEQLDTYIYERDIKVLERRIDGKEPAELSRWSKDVNHIKGKGFPKP